MSASRKKTKQKDQLPLDENRFLLDDEDDWATSMLLHDDVLENNPALANFQLTSSNNAFLRSLAGKPIRTTTTINTDNMRLTFVPELDDTLKVNCVSQCTCCNKCPYCLYQIVSRKSPLEHSAGIKTVVNKCTQTVRLPLLVQPKTTDRVVPRTRGNVEQMGDMCNIRQLFSADDDKVTSPCVDKPLRYCHRRKADWSRRPSNDLYLHYVLWMVKELWDSFESDFKRKYAHEVDAYHLTDQELQFCRKRYGYFTDHRQLQDMLESALVQRNWRQQAAEWVNSSRKEDTLEQNEKPIPACQRNEKNGASTLSALVELDAETWQSANQPSVDMISANHHLVERKDRSKSEKTTRNRNAYRKLPSAVIASPTSRRLCIKSSQTPPRCVIRETQQRQINGKKQKKLTVRMTKTSTLRVELIKRRNLGRK